MFRENLQRGYATRQDCLLYIKCLAERLGYTPVKTDIGEREMYLIKTHYTAWTHVIRDAGLECSATSRQKKRRKARLDERLSFLAEVFIETPDRVDKEEYLFFEAGIYLREKTDFYRRYCDHKKCSERTDKSLSERDGGCSRIYTDGCNDAICKTD